MNYAALITAATKRQKRTRYEIAKRLGYKNVSVIYRLEKGTVGMSVNRLETLLELAGQRRANSGRMYIMLNKNNSRQLCKLRKRKRIICRKSIIYPFNIGSPTTIKQGMRNDSALAI